MTVTFSICSLLVKYLDLVSGEIYFVFEFHKYIYILISLKLAALATVIAWISREQDDGIVLFFHELSSFVKSFKP